MSTQRIETVLAARQELLSGHYRNVPAEFTCPSCLKPEQIFIAAEEIQCCKNCHTFHQSAVLIADDWTGVL